MSSVAKLAIEHDAWNGWFPIDHPIDGKLPTDMQDRFLVWIPDIGDYPGETQIAWWGKQGPSGMEAERIDGEWRYVETEVGAALNAAEPTQTHWQLLPGRPTGLVQ